MHMSGSGGENPFDEWNRPASQVTGLDQLMNQARPSVYNLPQNPMNHKSFKCNYIKARVEKDRMDWLIHS